jgi:predicted dinucleotide-binding enzyme
MQRRTDMNISILETGNMATGLAVLFAKAGHPVTLGAPEADKAKTNAQKLGHGISGASLSEAATAAELVVLAVPYAAAVEVIEATGGLIGKTVVDITNPLTADFSGLTIGHTTSAAEEIQKQVPEAKVVKAFNTVFASVLQADGKAAGRPATVFVAADDAEARKTVADLAASAGFVPLEVGGLSAARYLALPWRLSSSNIFWRVATPSKTFRKGGCAGINLSPERRKPGAGAGRGDGRITAGSGGAVSRGCTRIRSAAAGDSPDAGGKRRNIVEQCERHEMVRAAGIILSSLAGADQDAVPGPQGELAHLHISPIVVQGDLA